MGTVVCPFCGIPGRPRTPQPALPHNAKTPDFLRETGGLKCTPGRTRIPNLLVRSQTLYPIELRAHAFKLKQPAKVTGRWVKTTTVVAHRGVEPLLPT